MAIRPVNLDTIAELIGLPETSTVTFSGTDMSMIAVSDASLANYFTRFSDNFLIISSGVASDVTNANNGELEGTSLGETNRISVPGRSGQLTDRASLTFTFDAPEGYQRLGFSFTFLTDEYPEFVGRSVIDYFSVAVNGVEEAVDVSLNSAFFGGPTPTGTFFDGQTPPLYVSIPLVEGGENTITVQVADVIDYDYDSAAFIGDFNFERDQIVFVRFDEGELKWDDVNFFRRLFGANTFTLPAANLNPTEKSQIVTRLENIFDEFRITFVTTEPTEGDYSTLYIVGGSVNDLPEWLEAPANLAGRAQKIDYENKDPSDIAFILSDQISGGVNAIAQVAAHELGHLLGLRHIDDKSLLNGAELMYPIAAASRDDISDTDLPISEFNADRMLTPQRDNGVIRMQNAYQELVRNVGLKSDRLEEGQGLTLAEEEGFFNQILNFFGFSVQNSLYDVFALISDSEGEIRQIISVGDVNPGQLLQFRAPTVSADNVFIIGRSSESSDEYDLLLSDDSSQNVDFEEVGLYGVVSQNSVSVEDLEAEDVELTLNQIDENGDLEVIEEDVEVVIVSNDEVSEQGATEGHDIITGSEDADLLIALGGNDIIDGKKGSDSIIAGKGDDYVEDYLGNENISGDEGHDTLFALSGINIISGGEGSDFIVGGFQADEILGNDGNDVLRGDASNVLTGSDVIRAGKGNDVIMGGGGADTFIFTTDDGDDVIGQFDITDVSFDSNTMEYTVAMINSLDFQVGVDRIQLSNFLTVSASNVLDFVTDETDGAVFSAENTRITFFGVTANQLDDNDFVFV